MLGEPFIQRPPKDDSRNTPEGLEMADRQIERLMLLGRWTEPAYADHNFKPREISDASTSDHVGQVAASGGAGRVDDDAAPF